MVEFRLKVAAIVQAVLKRDGKVVGKTPKRRLKRGKRSLTVHFDRPPDTLRLKARPIDRCPD